MQSNIESRLTQALSLFNAFAAGDLDHWQRQLSPDFTFAYPGVPEGKGIAAARAYNEPFNAAFCDWDIKVHQSAVDGDTTFLLLTVQATHAKPLMTPEGTLVATGRRGAVKAVLVSKTRDGRICHEATYWNVPDLIAQLVPASA